MDVPTGPASSFFLAYSAAPGQAAEDGDGDNSRYTQALAAAMGTPGLELDDVFKEAGRQVKAATASRQVPWMEGSWYGKFFFAPPGSRPAAKPDSPSLAGDAPDPATEMWLQIREIGDIRILERFLSEYPDSRYRLSAEARLAALRTAVPSGKDRLRDCGWCPELVEIPAGQFRMGDLAGVGDADEKPVRHVRVPRFALARHETTVRQFRRFVMATGYRTDAERDGGKGCRTVEIATRNKWDWTPGRSWRSLE